MTNRELKELLTQLATITRAQNKLSPEYQTLVKTCTVISDLIKFDEK